jgi:tripartite-type tricarboxylate transporter receptor subunit TctC
LSEAQVNGASCAGRRVRAGGVACDLLRRDAATRAVMPRRIAVYDAGNELDTRCPCAVHPRARSPLEENMKRLTVPALAVALSLVQLALVGAAAGQPAYPAKPIRFIVPFPPGGSTDPMARMAGGKLAERLGQAVVVDNRPGASGIVGTEVVAKAAPDGYTILLGSAPFAINAALVRKLPYDPIKDFDPVATIAQSRQILVLHPAVPARTLKEFIALVRSRPGQLNYATSGTGNLNHLAGELFNSMAGVKMAHVPYKGGGPAITDVVAGQVELTFQVPISVLPHIASGKLKPIAITGDARVGALPQVPTFAEAGLPGFDLAGWTGILVPAGTPRPVVERIASELAKIIAQPEVHQQLVKQGMEPLILSPEQFAAKLKRDIAKFSAIIKAADIRLD